MSFDVSIFQGAALAGEQLLEQQLFGNVPGAVCTGVQKLMQTWVMEFLSATGSYRFLPRRGTGFLPSLLQGRLRTELDVQTAFNFAADAVSRNLAADEAADAPDDERLASATLTGISLVNDTILLDIQLTSQAGDSRQAVLPLSVAPITPDF